MKSAAAMDGGEDERTGAFQWLMLSAGILSTGNNWMVSIPAHPHALSLGPCADRDRLPGHQRGVHGAAAASINSSFAGESLP